ncbi:uncharacterized protein LOC123559566 [Mercenaria mercenaria]|uniref:uncharacterized protein LOC123559566 n=1 Tax=Mercenaria mercenaria TaxID=6596 RepID=UPI00234E4CFA|nr:uncharacterized protein LOC123559566 [Mercenaria mercenaria]
MSYTCLSYMVYDWPLDKNSTNQKHDINTGSNRSYHTVTSVSARGMDEVYEECFSYDVKTTEDDDFDSPSKPDTPLMPGTPCTPASDHDTDRSGFSISMDSGIGSPSPFGMQNDSSHKIIDVRSLKAENYKKDGGVKRGSKSSTEHTSKEKHRRERIKDSCDQLRVLLPYIRGRKTDMASILEMGVDYLRIVNMCMPQSLHDQIVEMLGKDPSLVPNKESTLRGKKGVPKSSGKSLQQLSPVPPRGALAELIEKTSGSQKKTSKEMSLSEIASSCDILGKSSNKRIRLQVNDTGDHSPDSFHLDARLEPTLAGHTDVVPSTYTAQPYSKSYTRSEEKSFSGVYSPSNYTDGYNTAQQIFNTYNANKNSVLDSSSYRSSYSTDSTLYHYYPSLVSSTPPQNRIYPSTTDLVSPNNVLSTMPYTAVHTRLENVALMSETPGKED